MSQKTNRKILQKTVCPDYWLGITGSTSNSLVALLQELLTQSCQALQGTPQLFDKSNLGKIVAVAMGNKWLQSTNDCLVGTNGLQLQL